MCSHPNVILHLVSSLYTHRGPTINDATLFSTITLPHLDRFFTLFVVVETEINTVQLTYLMT